VIEPLIAPVVVLAPDPVVEATASAPVVAAAPAPAVASEPELASPAPPPTERFAGIISGVGAEDDATRERQAKAEAAKADRKFRAANPEPKDLVVPGLWLGDLGSALDGASLAACGVTHVVDLASAVVHDRFKGLSRFEVRRGDEGCDFADSCPSLVAKLVVVVDDVENAPLGAHFRAINAFIDRAAREPGAGACLVHCVRGKSRSATAVAQYLMHPALPHFTQGQRVQARFGGKGKYYWATVAAARDDDTYELRYDDGDSEKAVWAEHICAPAAAGEFAEGTRVEARFGGRDKWFAGVVTAANFDGTYAVRYDDGDAEPAVAFVRSASGLNPATAPALAGAGAAAEGGAAAAAAEPKHLRGLTLRHALRLIQQARPCFALNPGFKKTLMKLEALLRPSEPPSIVLSLKSHKPKLEKRNPEYGAARRG